MATNLEWNTFVSTCPKRVDYSTLSNLRVGFVANPNALCLKWHWVWTIGRMKHAHNRHANPIHPAREGQIGRYSRNLLMNMYAKRVFTCVSVYHNAVASLSLPYAS
jgi:hypothetical protein